MSQNSAFEGCVYGPNTSPILPVNRKYKVYSCIYMLVSISKSGTVLWFSYPLWKIMKLVRRVRTGARKLESFRSFWRQNNPNYISLSSVCLNLMPYIT